MNLGPHTCKTCALPLSYIFIRLVLSNRDPKKDVEQRFKAQAALYPDPRDLQS